MQYATTRPALSHRSRSCFKPNAPGDLRPLDCHVWELWNAAAGCCWRAAAFWSSLAFTGVSEWHEDEVQADYQTLAFTAALARQELHGAQFEGTSILGWAAELDTIRAHVGPFTFNGRPYSSACEAAVAFAEGVLGAVNAIHDEMLPWHAEDWDKLRNCTMPDPKPIIVAVRQEVMAIRLGGRGPVGECPVVIGQVDYQGRRHIRVRAVDGEWHSFVISATQGWVLGALVDAYPGRLSGNELNAAAGLNSEARKHVKELCKMDPVIESVLSPLTGPGAPPKGAKGYGLRIDR